MTNDTRHGRGRRGRREWALDLERKGRSATSAEDREEIRAYLSGAVPEEWFVGAPEVSVDDYEIYVVGTLAAPTVEGGAKVETAELARIERFREDTRDERIRIAQLVEAHYERKVAWGAVSGSTRRMFTTASVPAMTRLQLRHRQTLDTLVEAGVARSRSEALAWCVELVSRHESDWIEGLRQALDSVEAARAAGPRSAQPDPEE